MDEYASKQEMSVSFIKYPICDFLLKKQYNVSSMGPQIFKKAKSQLKILGDKEGNKKLHTDDPKIFQHHQTTFSHQGYQAPLMCAPLAWALIQGQRHQTQT